MGFGLKPEMGSIQSPYFLVVENKGIPHTFESTAQMIYPVRLWIDPDTREIGPSRRVICSIALDRPSKVERIVRWYRGVFRRGVLGYCRRMKTRGLAHRWQGRVMIKVRRRVECVAPFRSDGMTWLLLWLVHKVLRGWLGGSPITEK